MDKPSEPQTWRGLPKPLQHRLSMKWSTVESLRILEQRCRAQHGTTYAVLLTNAGLIQGELADIADTYEENLDVDVVEDLDVASAVSHLRTELWSLYAERDDQLTPSDTGAVVHLVNAEMKSGSRTCRFRHLALFADQVVAFTLTSHPLV
ncbi:hypothetical protein GCM10025857_38400 [Alicyclobacillus contaminans]|uniref:hypothetical protein n=1 Tax=Alicyclobacillus contaminans TaxID=392016 RepID=UPI000401625A|nr:hypothetical protein [Alicyclobacillus contaminans]GMA52483.1 hypothetical protein GCM10025857_38400 [Alicyclobacillus contaminans]